MKLQLLILCFSLLCGLSLGIPYLRQLASPHGRKMGTAVDHSMLTSDNNYATVLAQQYDLVTAENEMKWGAIQPSQGTFTYSQGDQIVAFAQKNNQTIRGHNLCWGQSNPNWLQNGGFNGTRLQQLLQQYISNVTAHYKGKVYSWDVVNEAVSDSATPTNYLKNTLWYPAVPNYIDLAFQWASQGDPNAKLFYNDYSAEGMNAKSDAVYNMVKSMKTRGIPIHGVGLQCHFGVSGSPSVSDIAKNIQRLGDLGLEVHLTEFDYTLSSSSQETQQATYYHDLLQMCLQQPACKVFETWGFTDKDTWRGSAALPLPFDVNYQPKPCFNSMATLLQG